MFNTSNLEESIHYYTDDLNTLPTIVELLDIAAKAAYRIDQYNIQSLADNLHESEINIRLVSKKK